MSGLHSDHSLALLEAALAYAARGWRVIPVWWPKDGRCACGKTTCHSPAKHPIGPLVPHGLKEATTDPEFIKAWWGQYPRANIGLVTGPESGLLVVDLDPRNGGHPDRLPGPVPLTPTARTGGSGWHFYLAHPGENLRFPAKLPGCPGGDLKGAGGYVLAPPSWHISGKCYTWEIPPTHPLAPCLEWLLKAAQRPKPHPAPRPAVACSGMALGTPYGRAALRNELLRLAQTTEGDRNNVLNRVAFSLGRLVARGHLDESTVTGLLETVGANIGLGGSEVERTLRSGLKAGVKVPHV